MESSGSNRHHDPGVFYLTMYCTSAQEVGAKKSMGLREAVRGFLHWSLTPINDVDTGSGAGND